MTKHAPATPLPWNLNFNKYDEQVRVYSEHFPVTNSMLKSRNALADAAYTAHAANAYPKLVQELRLCNVNEQGEQKQNTPIGILLRELGELDYE